MFSGCKNLSEIYYAGSEADWAKIKVDSSNSDWLNKLYYYSASQPTVTGYFWRYVDGVPTVWAENIPYYSAGLDFVSNGNGTCYLNGMGSCTDTVVYIPPFSPNGDKVTGMGIYGGGSLGADVTEVHIPNTVEEIHYRIWTKSKKLSNIVVDDSNPNFKAVDGVLYSKDGSRIVKYSPAKTNSSFVITKNVTDIDMYAFAVSERLTSVTFESTGWWHYAYFCEDPNLVILPVIGLFPSSYLADPATAALYLKSEYCGYSWYQD